MAAANKFQIQVVAIDKATQVFRKVNDSMADVMRPATRLQRQLGALSKEAHLDKLTKGFGIVSQAAERVADNLGLAITPLEALAGLGAAGGIVATLTAAVGATALFAKNWGQSGAEIGRTSRQIGVNAQELQDYRNAAKMAGVSQDALTDGFANMAQALHQMQYGNRGDLAGLLQLWNVSLKTDKNGAIKVTQMFDDIADALSRYSNPQTRLNLARLFGLEELLPFIDKGKAGMHELIDLARKVSPARSDKSLGDATQFETSWAKLKSAAGAITDRAGDRLGPKWAGAMDAATDWLTGSKSAGQVVSDSARATTKAREDFWKNVVGIDFHSLRFGANEREPVRHSMSGTVTGPLSGNDTGSTLIGGKRVDPNDQAARDRDRLSILEHELGGAVDPSARAALQHDIARTKAQIAIESGAPEQRVKVDVQFHNAPAGTTARISNGDGWGSTRVVHTEPGMP